MNVKVASGLVVVSLSLMVSTALGQQSRAVDAHFFKPALFSGGIFAVDRAAPMIKWQPAFKFFFNYEGTPLKLTFPQDATKKPIGEQKILSNAQVFNLQAQFAFTRWLELGVDFPMLRHSFVTNPAEDTMEGFELLTASDLKGTIPYAAVAPLDTRVGFKINFLDKSGFSLALALQGSLPLGDEEVFAGESGFTFQPKVLAGFNRGSLALAVNMGYLMRKRSLVLWDDPSTPIVKKVPLLGVDDEISFGAGVLYQFQKYIGAGAEVYGTLPVALGTYEILGKELKVDKNGQPYEDVSREVVDPPGSAVVEALGGLIIVPTQGLNVAVGGGAGLVGAERQVAYRLFLGISWLPGKTGPMLGGDQDKDGIPDAKDACPSQAEDKDGFQDDDGCPDLDNDEDGIPDKEDKCPIEAEDKDGFQDDDGCPDLDNDGDGIPDAKDGCPDQAEDRDGFQDSDGCPDPDNDGDGIADAKDSCPTEPETANGFQDEDGCPDSVPTGVTVQAGMITIPEQIRFMRGSAVIDKVSFKLLDAVAQKIRENPQIGQIRIEGHCDNSGGADANQTLSQSRADAVRQYLVSKGVRADQVQAVGYGSSRPITTNDTEEGRKKNRRVEFVIIRSKEGTK